MRTLWLCTFAIAAIWPQLAVGRPRLELYSSVDDGKPSAEWKYARVGQRVTLHAVLRGGQAKGYRWFKLEPTTRWVDNTKPHFHYAPISYAATELESCRDRPSCPADVSPTHLPRVDAVPGAGTMAFQVKAVLADGSELSTPGLESVESGGLSRAVHRVTFRKDDGYLGYLTELFNTPYIFGSAGPDGRNQTDLLIGSDCADLAVYGRRRMGEKAPYTSSFTIDRQAPEIAYATDQTDAGVALGRNGRPIALGTQAGQVASGDLLHFPRSRHVGVLYEDRPPLGVLDMGDWMLHTCWAPPTVEPIGASGCASLPIRVLRFPTPGSRTAGR